jgi:antitoxin HicB
MKKRSIDYYMGLPYTREIVKSDDGYFIKIKELKGCISVGETVEDAWAMINDALESWFEVAIDDGIEIPLPDSMNEKEYSGNFALRMPKSLHADVAKQAAVEGVSVNQYLVSIIAAGNQNFKFSQKKKLSSIKSRKCSAV